VLGSLIIITRKVRRRRLGLVADFCPDCGEVRPMWYCRRRNMDHLFGIPTGLGVILDDAVICDECGCEMETQRADYAALSRSSATTSSIERLIDETHPDVFERRDHLIAPTRQARQADAPATMRIDYIAKILIRTGQGLDHRLLQVRLDHWSGLALLGVLAPIIIAICRSNSWLAKGPLWVGDVLFYSALASAAVLLLLLATDVQRYMNREVYPRLLRKLQPLKLSAEEIACAADALKQSQYTIGRKISVARLCRMLT